MRTMVRGKLTLLFMTCALLLAIPAVALADDIANSLDPSVDAVAEEMPLVVGGATGTTNLYIVERNGDGKNGCNLTGSTSFSASVNSSNTSVATVSPSSVTFNACGEVKALTVTPHSQGTATISLTETANTTSGSFNLAPAAFTVKVAPPPNTAPSIEVTGVTGGASYNKGSVPAATCEVTDAEDGNKSFPAQLSAITGPYASDGIGTQTASCSYTDGGGLTAEASETYGIVDPSAPVIGYTLNPANADGSNGWYKSNVSLTWDVSEPQSPNSLQKTGCVDQNITSDQAATTYTCSATSAGGSAAEQSVTIKRDGSAPVITDAGAKANPDGTNGWYITEAFNKFTASDSPSGLANPSKASFEVGTGTAEGSGLKVESGPVSDNAGNTAASKTSTASFNVDLSNPTNVQFSGGPVAGSSHYFGSVPNAPTCSAEDAVSSLKDCKVTGYSTAVGNHTLTATATDNAGRTATATRSYTVLAWDFRGFYSPVDMNNVLNSVKGGSTVPIKFELFAGNTELTDTANVVQPLKATKVACDSGATLDEIELLASGSTSLRYDSTAGQYIYNWKTPTGAGTCYNVTISSLDGSSQTAKFKLK